MTHVAIKTGKHSISDVALQQLALRKHLLGPFLDGLNFEPYVENKSREIFESHMAYRTKFNPHANDVVVDTAWQFSWPKAGKDLLLFFEATLYNPTPQETYLLRQATKKIEHCVRDLVMEAMVRRHRQHSVSAHPHCRSAATPCCCATRPRQLSRSWARF